jgi:hypothetical protein
VKIPKDIKNALKLTRSSVTSKTRTILCKENNGDNPIIQPRDIAKAICLIELSDFNAENIFANNAIRMRLTGIMPIQLTVNAN